MQRPLGRQVTHPACKRQISNLLGLSGLGRAPAPPRATHSPSLWQLLPVPPCSSCHALMLTPSHQLLPNSSSEGMGTLPRTGVRTGPNPHPSEPCLRATAAQGWLPQCHWRGPSSGVPLVRHSPSSGTPSGSGQSSPLHPTGQQSPIVLAEPIWPSPQPELQSLYETREKITALNAFWLFPSKSLWYPPSLI